MIGQLQEHPLTELLHEISAAGLSGALRLEHERLKTVVYLADGEVIYAASNLRLHRLSECVRRWHVLSVNELSTLPADASDLDFAAALMEEKAFSRDSLEAIQARQVAEVLRSALLWTEGTWEFDGRVRMAQDMRVQIDVRSLLMEGARRLPVEFIAARFTDTHEKLSPVMHAPANFELLPKEAFVLSRVDAPMALSELLAISTLPETEAQHIVYTLALGGLLERGRWRQAFTPEMVARARSVKADSKHAPRAEMSQPPIKEARVSMPPVVAAAAAAPPPVKTEANEVSEVEDLFARLAIAETHYQVLGVIRTATIGEIKGSYHRLAKRFHPDRFHSDADEKRHARIEEAFARIAQAYETLKDKQARAAYDLKLSYQSMPSQTGGAFAQSSMQNSGGPATIAGAETNETAAQAKAALLRQAEAGFQRGLLALKQGKPTIAISSLGEAARLVPREARYRAYHGRALAENEGTRRQAEAELKAAISLDSNNAGYYVMLAEFYLKIGLPRRAQSELERALAIAPQNATARQLLDTIHATLKG